MGFGARTVDLLLIVLLLPLLLPLALLVALAVLLDSPGRVIYGARRIGADGKPFAMLKFRTMKRDSRGVGLTADADERITPLGRLLRTTRLDELPQLWNVIRGDMRLVGPRPEAEEFVAHYPSEYDLILTVPPGLTGSTQLEYALTEARMLSAKDDPARFYAEQIMPRKVRLDLAYAQTRTLPGDLGILFRTFALPIRSLMARMYASFRQRRVPLALSAGTGAMVLVLFALMLSGGAPQ